MATIPRPLSQRERQIATLLVQAKENKEIADELGLTEGTVKQYIFRMMNKRKFRNRVAIAVWAAQNLVAAAQ